VGQFKNPTGIAVDAKGDIYVADSYNERVERIDPRGTSRNLGERAMDADSFLYQKAWLLTGTAMSTFRTRATAEFRSFRWRESFGRYGASTPPYRRCWASRLGSRWTPGQRLRDGRHQQPHSGACAKRSGRGDLWPLRLRSKGESQATRRVLLSARHHRGPAGRHLRCRYG
jgi:hypothetical protein